MVASSTSDLKSRKALAWVAFWKADKIIVDGDPEGENVSRMVSIFVMK